jgi:hypothetical protein
VDRNGNAYVTGYSDAAWGCLPSSCTVRAYNADHDAFAAKILDILPLTAPSGLTASAASSSQINLSWTDNSSDESDFRLERSLNGSSGWTQIHIAAANHPSYSNTGLSACTTYYYRVRAYRWYDELYSAYSNTASAKTICPIPQSPTLISPSGLIADTHPPYSWNASNYATAYRIGVYSVSSASYVILTDVSSSACSAGVCTYHPATVLAAGDHRFKVLAKNSSGASAYSAWMDFSVVTAAPAVPTLISPSGTIADTHPPYIWNAPDDANAYRIGVYSFSSASYVILLDVPGSACVAGVCVYHPDTVLAAGVYKFKVLAKNPAGASDYSAWMTFTITDTVPAVPTLISPSGAIADTHPPYSWNASDGASSYRVGVYSEGSASYVILTDVDDAACAGGVCTYHPATVLAAGNYRFKVLARNAIGASAYSTWMNFIVSP